MRSVLFTITTVVLAFATVVFGSYESLRKTGKISRLKARHVMGETSTKAPSSNAARQSPHRRVNFTPKRAQEGSVEHTMAFRDALFALSPISSLSPPSATASAPPSVLIVSGRGYYVIRDNRVPFRFDGLDYFWDATFLDPSDEYPVICVNPIDRSDPKLGKISFSNGSRPREIAWHCPADNGCCGYECCHQRTAFQSMVSAFPNC